jgi:hypothetical protein
MSRHEPERLLSALNELERKHDERPGAERRWFPRRRPGSSGSQTCVDNGVVTLLGLDRMELG